MISRVINNCYTTLFPQDTSLVQAVYFRSPAAIQTAIDRGVDPNIRDLVN